MTEAKLSLYEGIQEVFEMTDLNMLCVARNSGYGVKMKL
jgi:hypothetical protein